MCLRIVNRSCFLYDTHHVNHTIKTCSLMCSTVNYTVYYFYTEKTLQIPMGYSESVYRRRTDNILVNIKKYKIQKDKQQSTKHTHETKDRVTRTPLKLTGYRKQPYKTKNTTQKATIRNDTDSTKIPGWVGGGVGGHVLAKSKQSLLLIRHQPCYGF